ncbi:integrase arm-type DNA-binding domain-containing protein [Pasteurellaceae bacterium HPA106]|uniref:tyrosine-type recombinase/integrase n=1 Tax=Spirabiliibacterium pneumoniae TaxID=221400 RepID=UPI001AAD1650|nr:integrase arm-type DNA-binding domain-containing protein [Spirabiliibacterium pneumoniae]MBE2896577.1 integrase arm-type DNA-binding domain-containing protein [Spirabiliibacterium pneumoniae]
MARLTTPLTSLQIERAKPKAKEYSLCDGQGLKVRISPNGVKKWIFNYNRPNKTRTQISLGKFPAVSLAQARELRLEYLSLLSRGIDPQIHRKQQSAKDNNQAEITFFAIACRWKEKREKEIEPLTMKKNWRRLEQYIFPIIGEYPIAEITPPLLIEVLQPINKKDINDTLHRLINLVNQILHYGVNIGAIEVNYCVKVADAFHKKTKEHQKAIHYRELPKLIRDMKNGPANPLTKLLFEWELLTMVRPSEAVSVEWSEIDFDEKLWHIPAEKMKKTKAGRFALSVPLSRQALQVLEKMKPISSHLKYVFPHDKNPRKHASNGTVLNAIYDIGYKGEQTAHGLRSIGRTYLNDYGGLDHNTIEACLAHKTGTEVSRAYNRSDYLKLREPIMQIWADYVEQCATANTL